MRNFTKKIPPLLALVTPVAAELSGGSIAGITIAGVIVFLGGAAAVVACVVRNSNNNHTIRTHEVERGVDGNGNPIVKEKTIEDSTISTDNIGSPEIGRDLVGVAKEGMTILETVLTSGLSPLAKVVAKTSAVATTDKNGAINSVTAVTSASLIKPNDISQPITEGLSQEWFNKDLKDGGGTKVAQTIALAKKAQALADVAEADALLAIALEQQDIDKRPLHEPEGGQSHTIPVSTMQDEANVPHPQNDHVTLIGVAGEVA